MEFLYLAAVFLLLINMVASDIPFGFNFGNTPFNPNSNSNTQSQQNNFPIFQSRYTRTTSVTSTRRSRSTSTTKTSTTKTSTKTSTTKTSTTKTSTTKTSTKTSTTTTTTTTSSKSITTNACAQQCSSILSTCKDFGLSNLNENTLEAIFPPPNNSLGECLCKSEQFVVGSYSECMECLINNSNKTDISAPDQILQNNCQVFANNTEIDTGKIPENTVEIKEESVNVRNIIIICAGVSGILLIIGGFKFRNYMEDRKRESVLLF